MHMTKNYNAMERDMFAVTCFALNAKHAPHGGR